MTGTTTLPAHDTPGTAPGHDEHPPGCAGCPDRRQVLRAAGGLSVAAAGVAVLAACGGGSPSGSSGEATALPSSTEPLAQLADVPVGGSLLVEAGSLKVLLVQATEGTVTGLSAVCTHQGCTVLPSNDALHCPCHNSLFQLDGVPVSGPAKEALAPVAVHVRDGAVFAGEA